MRIHGSLLLVAGCILAAGVESALGAPPVVAKGKFFGQKISTLPELFAPDVMVAFGIRKTPFFSSDGSEMFWSVDRGRWRSAIATSRLRDGIWSEPETLLFSSGEFFDHNPVLAADGATLVFASNRPVAGKQPGTILGTPAPASDLWAATRTGGRWSDPVPLGLNSDFDDDSPALAANGTLYFSSARPGAPGPGAMYMAKRRESGWAAPVALPEGLNTPAGEMVNSVAPDESSLIFWSMRPGTDAGLYVSFRDENGRWSAPARLPGEVTRMRGHSAALTPDGTALLFTSAAGGAGPQIYWMDASPIAALRPGPRGYEGAAEHREAMDRVGFLAGEWSGRGWIEIAPGQRPQFTLDESVEPLLDGTVLFFRGAAKARIGDGPEKVVSEGLGLLSYDPVTKRYRLHHYESGGGYETVEGRFEEGKLRYTLNGGTIFVTNWLDADGSWVRRNERRTADGKLEVISEVRAKKSGAQSSRSSEHQP